MQKAHLVIPRRSLFSQHAKIVQVEKRNKFIELYRIFITFERKTETHAKHYHFLFCIRHGRSDI